MKKVALSFLALFAAGSMAFAADLAVATPLTAKVAAEGSTTFTYDLGGAGWGVANAASASFFLNLIGDVDAGNDAAVASKSAVGKISANFRLGIKSGTTDTNATITKGATGEAATVPVPNITNSASLDYAKIVIGDLYIKIAGVTDPSIGYSDTFTYFDGNLVSGKSIKLAYGSSVGNQSSGAGYEIGYAIAKLVALTFQVGVDSGAVSTSHTFDYSAKAAVNAVDKLTLELGYIGGTASGKSSGVAVKAGYDLGIANIWAAYNMDLTASASTAILSVDAPVIDGLKVSAGVSPLGTLDAIAKVSVGDKLLAVGTLDVGYQLSGSKVYADLELTKIVTDVTIYTKVENSDKLYYAVGASASKLLDNVTFSAELNSSKGTAGQLAVTAKIDL